MVVLSSSLKKEPSTVAGCKPFRVTLSGRRGLEKRGFWIPQCNQGNGQCQCASTLITCIGELTEEYRTRMYALLELYACPISKTEPIICIDQKSLQLIGHSREPLPMTPYKPSKQDYEYVRNGTTNLFVAVEPKAGQRIVSVTVRRGKIDSPAFIDELLTGAYAKARRIHLVLDNLNTHFEKCFDDMLGNRAVAAGTGCRLSPGDPRTSVGLHAPVPAAAACLGSGHGGSRPQERQQRIVERLFVRHVQPVRRTAHPHQLAVEHGAVGALARAFDGHDRVRL